VMQVCITFVRIEGVYSNSNLNDDLRLVLNECGRRCYAEWLIVKCDMNECELLQRECDDTAIIKEVVGIVVVYSNIVTNDCVCNERAISKSSTIEWN